MNTNVTQYFNFMTKNRNTYNSLALQELAKRLAFRSKTISMTDLYVSPWTNFQLSKEELTEKIIARISNNLIIESEQCREFFDRHLFCRYSMNTPMLKTQKHKKTSKQKIVEDKLLQWEEDRKKAIEKKIIQQLDEFFDARRLAEHLAGIIRYDSGMTWDGGGRYL